MAAHHGIGPECTPSAKGACVMQTDTATRQPLLLVEDSDEDFESLTWAMRRLTVTNSLVRCRDGGEALDYLHRRGRYADRDPASVPSMILLDLNLTEMDGRQVLSALKADERFRRIPVVIWTSSQNPRDVEYCYGSGANSYILKPQQVDDLLHTVALLDRYWLRVVTLPQILN